MMRVSLPLAALTVAAIVAACDSTAPDLSPTLELDAPATAVAGEPVTVDATAADDRGLERLVVVWGDGAVDSLSLSGDSATTGLQHTFATLGAFQVQATVRDRAGQTASASRTIDVGPAAVVIDPAGGDTINALGFTATLSARALDAAGEELADFAPAWEALDPATATVGSDGVVTAEAPGEARIRAGGGAAADTVAVLVRQVPKTVVLTAPDTLAVRESRAAEALVTDSNDVSIAAPELVWSSTAPAVATVDGEGRLAGAEEGTVSIIATAAPAADTATLVVALGLLFAGAQADDPGYLDVFTMTRHRTGRLNISDWEWMDLGGVWSPDRARIAFWSGRDGSAIMIANADGSGLVAVPTGLVQPPSDLAWSPGGDRIAFSARGEDAESENIDIYVINVDGTALTRLTADSAEQRHPAWSPDGTRIAFSNFVYGDGTVTSDVLVMDAGGSNVVNLTEGSAEGSYAPVWSPDGTEIAFTSGASDPSRSLIHRMNADGTNIRLIGAHHVVQFDWSPDAALFLFATEHVDGQRDIFSMPADGGELTRITNDALWEQDVRWR